MCADEEACFESFDAAHACTVTHPALVALRNMQRITARIDRSMAATLRAHDINPAQLTLLRSIGANEGLTQQELAGAIGLSRANISQLLDRLQAAELIARVPSGRAYALYLTDASRNLLQTVLPEMEALILGQFAVLSPEDQATLDRILAKLDAEPPQHD
jgi:DNA-binding MarR family transcriptional regulator